MVTINELRRPKFLNMAVFDLSATFLFSMIVHSLLWFYPHEMKNKEKRTYLQYTLSAILIYIMFLAIGVIFHRIFRVQSAFSGYLGFNDMPIRSLR